VKFTDNFGRFWHNVFFQRSRSSARSSEILCAKKFETWYIFSERDRQAQILQNTNIQKTSIIWYKSYRNVDLLTFLDDFDIRCFSKEVGALHVLQRLYVQRNLRLEIFFLTEIAKHKSYKIPISRKHSLYGTNHVEIVDLLTFLDDFWHNVFFQRRRSSACSSEIVCAKKFETWNIFFWQRSQSTNLTKSQFSKIIHSVL